MMKDPDGLLFESPPLHFFSNASPRMRAYFWRSLMVEYQTPREAVNHFVSIMKNSLIEQAFIVLLTEGVEDNWQQFTAIDAIQRAVQHENFESKAGSKDVRRCIKVNSKRVTNNNPRN